MTSFVLAAAEIVIGWLDTFPLVVASFDFSGTTGGADWEHAPKVNGEKNDSKPCGELFGSQHGRHTLFPGYSSSSIASIAQV